MIHYSLNAANKCLENGNTIRGLFYGDSWIHYPIPGSSNLTHCFQDVEDILCLGENGMRLLKADTYIEKELSRFAKEYSPEFVVISGGGNDFVAMQNFSRADIEKTCYLLRSKILEIVDLFPNTVQIFLHCYDYPPLTGKGLLWQKAWLSEAIKRTKYAGDKEFLVKYLIDSLYFEHKLLSNTFDNVHAVDTRGLVKTHNWQNELHPNMRGFVSVSSCLRAEINKVMK